jgi:large subunit ribosomal protein L4
MPKKMRQAALRSALSAKAAEAGIVVVDELALPELKTRFMAGALKNLVGEATVLVVLPEKDQGYEQVVRTTGNLADTKVLLAKYLNIRDLFGYDKLILPVTALDAITAHLG